MFNNKRIKNLELEVQCWSTLKQRLDKVENELRNVQSQVLGRKKEKTPLPWGGHYYSTEVTGLVELVEKQNKEIDKLKDIIRELTDFVYENVKAKEEE